MKHSEKNSHCFYYLLIFIFLSISFLIETASKSNYLLKKRNFSLFSLLIEITFHSAHVWYNRNK